MSSEEAFRILFAAVATLLFQVALQLGLGHLCRLLNVRVPFESLFLVLIFCGTPTIAFFFHQNSWLAMLSISFGLAYVMGFNPSSGIRSPSFRILGFLRKEKAAVSAEAILAEIEKDSILERKIDDLVNDRWIVIDGTRARLSFLAKSLVRVSTVYRKALSVREGTG